MKKYFALYLAAGLVAVVFFGCVTNRVDWNARVGHYTFDQAVVELGPPDKQARLSDGRNVAEWVYRYQNGTTVSVGSGYFYPGSMGVVQTTGPTYYERKLRLTFTPDNVLTNWSRN